MQRCRLKIIKPRDEAILILTHHNYKFKYYYFYPQINRNGFLSFGEEYVANKLDRFPPFAFDVEAPPMIAALRANFFYDISSAVYSRVSDDPYTLSQVVRMMTDLNPKLSSYSPRMAVIVTWFRFQPYTGEKVSYSMVLLK